MGKIKNIVFDFGGILLELDQNATFSAFSKLLNREVRKDDLDIELKTILNEFEKGNLSNETFLWKIQHLKKGNLDPRDIIKAWNAMLVGIRPEIFPFLLDVKSKYRCILLSNTNAIHIRYVLMNILEKVYGERNWSQYFDAIYYSHEMKMRKPDHEIYNKLIESEGIDPAETIFIDDLQVNVTAAIECGWKSVQHEPKLKIEEVFNQYIEDCESY